ncbi:PepSY domain-containing protein [Aequorivita capsosiphonis]|uniref:PepSY domain-containing protein n=1 Tax=Aequorivita capsosiphonis TaxID=487317 RepID=UPI000406D320|nr:PepSY domain-containing protein [Aequorivita capsosiphonis]
MTISIWRYSHLVLAAVSSLFLLMASITGGILAVEPISHQAEGYAVQDLDKVSLATAIDGLKDNYDEVFSLEVESSGFVKASVLTEDFETLDIYIDPKTGEQLGEVGKRPAIYSFATNLHRSLFLKSIGRFFVGLVSLLLFLIAVTGMFLLAKRQGGIKKLFSKVQKEYFEMRYHVILSRWLFIPIVIIALTGVYLSLEKFELLPDSKVEYRNNITLEETKTYENISEIPFFQETALTEVRKVDFPFSDDPEELFHIALKNKEIKVNQATGVIESSASYPLVKLASQLSLVLHTGEGSVLWSIVLLIASASLIFFMYSGFVMFFKRRKKVGVKSSIPDKDESEFILLVGSETGATYEFASRLFNALTNAGKKVYLSELNKYSTYAQAKHIVVLTSTYGEGEAPTNAWNFIDDFPEVQQPNTFQYAVVGFGSLEYPDYCQFAVDVDSLLAKQKEFDRLLPLYRINDENFTDFEKWTKKWGEAIELPLIIERPHKKRKKLKQIAFEVVERTEINQDDTFLLRLKPKRRTKFTSGDLLSIFPNETGNARQYSIAKIGKEILLSVKKHEFGKVSPYLSTLNKGDILTAAIEPNPHFHFPKKTSSAILIANGTGIAPFLGMMDKNKNTPINLIWGSRTQQSSHLYDGYFENNISKSKKNGNPDPLLKIHRCFSREENRLYVQDLVRQHQDAIIQSLEENGTLMICGSLSMQHDVLDILEKVLREKSGISLDMLLHKQQLRLDCY